MSKSLTRLALLSATLSVVFSLLPAIIDALTGNEEPVFELRFDGPFLWSTLAVITGALALVFGLIPAIAGGTDRFIPGIAALIGAGIVAWQVWGQ